jgi:hypothetical protein
MDSARPLNLVLHYGVITSALQARTDASSHACFAVTIASGNRTWCCDGRDRERKGRRDPDRAV